MIFLVILWAWCGGTGLAVIGLAIKGMRSGEIDPQAPLGPGFMQPKSVYEIQTWEKEKMNYL